MKQKGFSQYFVVIVLLLLGIVLINAWKKNNVEYTRAELVQDFEESLRKEDEDTLSGLGMQQVYSVTYPAEEAKSVKEIMQKWMASFDGKLGSDTEDFAPFLTIEEL